MIQFISDATPIILISPWKPLLVLITFISWGWLISTHLEKDARAAHLNAQRWNAIYASSAGVGLFIMLFGGMFYISFPLGIAVLITPVLIYWKIRNNAVADEYKFKLGTESLKGAMEKRKIAKAHKQVTLHFDGANGSLEVPDKETSEFDIYITAEESIHKAISNRASRLEFQLTSKGCQSIYLVDGIAHKQEPIAPDLGAKVIALLKETAGVNAKDVRRKQIGAFDISGDIPNTNVTLTASGSSNAHIIRLDFDRSERVLRDWNSLGFLPKQRELLDQLKENKRRHGVVLIGGPKQSGLTSTGYSILSQHDAYLCNIVTLEQEVVATLEGITHQDAGASDQPYATQLQTVIRRDPEVILAADLNDAEAAKIAAKPGQDGPLIFITMQASSMNELISKWAAFVADPRQAFTALQAVVFQKLSRKLCMNCRVSYKPSEDLGKQGLPIDAVEQLFRRGGQVTHKNKIVECPVCSGNGYMGQVGIFETLFLESETRQHLIAGDFKAALANARRNKRFTRLQEAAWQKVADGETSLEEFGRVNAKKKSKNKKDTSSTKKA